MDATLLTLRFVVGLLVAGHGAQKLFGWFGGHGIAGTAGWLDTMGYRPARLWAWLAGIAACSSRSDCSGPWAPWVLLRP